MSLLALDSYQKRTSSLLRFLMVGLVNTMVGLSTMYILLNVVGLRYYPSTFVGNGIGAIVSYFLNRSFTFNSGVSFKKGAPKFIVVILLCYYVAYSLSSVLAAEMGAIHFGFYKLSVDELAVFFGAGLYTILNFIGQKYLVFRVASLH